MIRKSLIILFSFCAASLLAEQVALAPSWSTYVGDSFSGGDGVNALTADHNGTLYAAGYLGSDWYALENDSPYEIQKLGDRPGFEDHLVFSVSAGGRLQWATAVGDPNGNDRLYGVAVTLDQLYVVGKRFPSPSHPENCTYGTVYSLNKNSGSLFWTRDIQIGHGLGSTNALFAVTVTPDGGGVAVGYTSCANEAGNVTPHSVNGTEYGVQFQGGLDAIAVRFSQEGTILWKRYLGGKFNDAAYACAVDAQGNIYVAGETYSSGWATIDSGEPIKTRPSGFFTKLNADGDHLWTSYLCGNGSISIRGIGVSPKEKAFYLVGKTSTGAMTDLGSGCLRKNSFSGAQDGFLLKCSETDDSSFSHEWLRFFGGAGEDSAAGISFDQAGHPVVCGDAGNDFFQSADGSAYGGTVDGYAFVLPADGGEPLWKAYMGGVVAEHAAAVIATPKGVAVAGTTRSQGWAHGGFWTDGTRKHEDGTPYPPGDGPTFGFLGAWQAPAPPVIERDLADLTVADGESVTFSFETGGSQPLSYYWSKNRVDFPFPEEVPRLTIPSVTVDDNGALFQCVVSNVSGVVTSRVATLTVTNLVPVISTQPQDQRVLDGGSAEFSIVASAGSVLPDFSWYRDERKLDDETSQILTLPKVVIADSGAKFFCVVSNASGAVTSRVATLAVDGLKPSIISQPQSVTVREGASATFTVQAGGGSSTLSYEWSRDGVAIPQANAESYTFVTSLADNGARFSCKVSNQFGSQNSDSALLTVTEKPKGKLEVTLAPDPALVRGAAWSIDQGANWLGSGSYQELREGSYQVSFKEVEAFQTPAATNLTVKSGETTAVTIRYIPITVSSSVIRSIASTNITLTITPPAGTPFWGVTERMPEGVTVTDPAGGTWDAATRQLTFAGVVPAQLTYTVSVESVGPYAINGSFYPYGGIEEVVGGDTEISLSSAIRTVSFNRVTIQVAPPPGTEPFVWALEENLPADVAPIDLAGPGVAWDATEHKITWVLLGGAAGTCSYTLTGNPGRYTVSGRVTFGDAYDPVTGASQVTIPDGGEPGTQKPIPVPTILSFSNTGLNRWTITFLSVENVIYAVQTNGNLSTKAWGTLRTVSGQPDQTTVDFDLQGKNSFFRIKAEEPNH